MKDFEVMQLPFMCQNRLVDLHEYLASISASSFGFGGWYIGFVALLIIAFTICVRL